MADDKKTANTPWQFKADNSSNGPVSNPRSISVQPVKWTASEFIEHNKGSEWYLMLAVGAVLLAAGIYLITKDVISAAMIVIVAIIFGIFASRKPRVLEYQVDGSGIHIGPKFYPYASFKSFAVISEDSINSIWLMPLKRFMPIITVYFAPNDGQKITAVLGNFLPVQNHQPDPIDRLMHRMRF